MKLYIYEYHQSYSNSAPKVKITSVEAEEKAKTLIIPHGQGIFNSRILKSELDKLSSPYVSHFEMYSLTCDEDTYKAFLSKAENFLAKEKESYEQKILMMDEGISNIKAVSEMFDELNPEKEDDLER